MAGGQVAPGSKRNGPAGLNDAKLTSRQLKDAAFDAAHTGERAIARVIASHVTATRGELLHALFLLSGALLRLGAWRGDDELIAARRVVGALHHVLATGDREALAALELPAIKILRKGPMPDVTRVHLRGRKNLSLLAEQIEDYIMVEGDPPSEARPAIVTLIAISLSEDVKTFGADFESIHARVAG